MSTEERVLSVLRENLENGGELAITPDSELSKDLHVDSLDALTIVYCLENEFSVALHDSALSGCRTVQDVIASLERALPRPPGDHHDTNSGSSMTCRSTRARPLSWTSIPTTLPCAPAWVTAWT